MRGASIIRCGMRASVLASISLLVAAGVTHADGRSSFGLSAFTTSAASQQSGAHADFTTSFSLATDSVGNPIEQIKDARVQLPSGLIGNPQAVPQCSARAFQSLDCPPDTQVGVIEPAFIVACHGVKTTLGAGGVGQIPPTSLTEAAAPADTVLTVESTAGIESGDTLTIGAGLAVQMAKVSSVTDATHLALSSGVGEALLVGTPVADDKITVASTAGFCLGENDTIAVGSGASAEMATIESVDDLTHLTLAAPLRNLHALGEPVTHVAVIHQGPLPLFNIEPSAGHAATLGVSIFVTSMFVQLDVRKDGGGLEAWLNDISSFLGIQGARITLWGVPAESSHDSVRCGELGSECGPAGIVPTPFMTNPTDCSARRTTTIVADSWQSPGRFVSATTTEPAPTGCELLQMAPTLTVRPDTVKADAPAGYTVDFRLPQDEDPFGLASPTLRTVSLTLPAGTSLSPPGAAGLEGCTDAQFAAGDCPGASTVGSTSISSPLLADTLEGHVYLAAPTPDEMYRVFAVASADNVTVRLVGHVKPDPRSGQLTIVFDGDPQFPLSEFRTTFFGGPSASLANPPTCGVATTTAQLVAYSGQTAALQSSFTVAADSRGTPCPAMQPFNPQVVAGTMTPLAGAFSPLTLTIAREDEQQNISTLTARLPAGLIGKLASIQTCREAEAAAGNCPASSRIGSTLVGVGAGSGPLYLSGSVFLTAPYHGAPFGLAIVVPATVGPFNLGTVVLRARIVIDPTDLHLTVSSDAIPQILAGIPLRVRMISLTLDRSGFIFNPTACAAQAITTIIGAAQGATALVSSPFGLAGCSALRFAPRLSASADAKASARGAGAALGVTIASTGAPAAAIRSTTVELPKQLRPRLTTIQQACPEATVFSDPTACPVVSRVGAVAVSTPILAAPLEGPVYLVARGGKTYPELLVILQSQGIRAEVVGTLGISKHGEISASFDRLPDVPITSFHIELPRGPHSLLGAAESLCARKLRLPYAIVAQNGTQIKHATSVSVRGCLKRRKTEKLAARRRQRVSRARNGAGAARQDHLPRGGGAA